VEVTVAAVVDQNRRLFACQTVRHQVPVVVMMALIVLLGRTLTDRLFVMMDGKIHQLNTSAIDRGV